MQIIKQQRISRCITRCVPDKNWNSRNWNNCGKLQMNLAVPTFCRIDFSALFLKQYAVQEKQGGINLAQ